MTINSCPAMALQFERSGGNILETQIDFGQIAIQGTAGVWTNLYRLVAAVPVPLARLMPIFEEAVIPIDLKDDVGFVPPSQLVWARNQD
jgi:hypothetical protein